MFDDDEVDAVMTNISSGSVGKVMPRSVMLGALAAAPASPNDAGSPSSLNAPDNGAVDSVALDTLALAKDPTPVADDAKLQGGEQDSMQLFFDDSDMIEDASAAVHVSAAAAAPAAAAAAPPPASEAKVYGRKNRDGGGAGGITAFFAPAPKVFDMPPPAAVAEEDDADVDADADDDADAEGDGDEGEDSDAGSVDSAASLARRLMEEQRRRQQEAFKVPVAAQVRKDIIDMVGEKGRCHIPLFPSFHRRHPLHCIPSGTLRTATRATRVTANLATPST